MKTFIKGLIILIMVIVCCSCNNSQNNTEASATDTEEDVFFTAHFAGNGNNMFYLFVNGRSGVQHICRTGSVFTDASMTILVDAEGKPILYGDRELMPVLSNRFFEIPFTSNKWRSLVVDRVTRVQYLSILGLALYADSEGKPILYEGSIP